MKKTIKTIFTITLVALMAIFSMSITSGAASMTDIAVPIGIGEEVESKALGISSSANYYKLECAKGDLTINYSADQRLTAVSVYDAYGNEVQYSKAEATVGKVRNLSFDKVTISKKTYVYWNSKLKSAEGKIIYKIKDAGPYYIQIGGLGSSYSGTFAFSVDAKALPKAEVTNIEPGITISVGDSFVLTGIVTPGNAEKVSVSYKNNGVITVSTKGKVTAKKNGESYVILKSGSMKLKIYITVIN